ncbi:MAG: hypothetical protein PGN21_05210 [Sphingomonas paucimobilis]
MNTGSAKYDIQYDIPNRTLEITSYGFWPAGLAAKFAAELIAKGTAIRLRHGPFYTMVDLRNAPIQPASVIDALAGMMPKALMLTKAPIAAVAASSLGKLQTERYLTAPNCRTFLDYDEADAWMRSTPLS